MGFEPNASATKVHHILLYGCEEPGFFIRDTPKVVWECGEMAVSATSEGKTPYGAAPVCGNGFKSILFSWALDAPSIDLPPGVGFVIGGRRSKVNYIILQVHYGNTNMFKKDRHLRDNSGIILHTVPGSDRSITKRAGLYLLLSYGFVTKGKSRHEIGCKITEDKVIHPFRFRTHTHKLGYNVAGYKRPFNAPSNHMQLIGQRDPQQPQMFYPIEDTTMEIGQGDGLYAYCDYNNTRGHDVMIGATNNDEMCNFYVMYWIDGPDLLEEQDCMQFNPSGGGHDIPYYDYK